MKWEQEYDDDNDNDDDDYDDDDDDDVPCLSPTFNMLAAALHPNLVKSSRI